MKKHLTLILAALFLCGAERIDAQISAGGLHSLFRCNTGQVMACGYNSEGALGDGSRMEKHSPVEVSWLYGITAVAAGYNHSLFLKCDGTVWACGWNNKGQLGEGSPFPSLYESYPIQVNINIGLPLTEITAVAAGYDHSLFIKNDGTVWACGNNYYGQLGSGSWHVDILAPVQVGGLSAIIAVAGGGGNIGGHSLFLKNDGTAWACGYNNMGQLGDGTTTQRLLPVQVSSLSGIIALEAGEWHSLFLKDDSTVWTCGWNYYGQLGDGTTANNRISPVQVSGLSGIVALAAGKRHSLFLRNDGTVWACGRNDYGQLGDGTTTDRRSPVQVSGLTGVITISACGDHSLFLKNDSTVWACGYNYYGQLGDGTTTDSYFPVQVQNLCVVSPTSTISGRILTEMGIPVPGVTVTLSGDSQTYITDFTGRYCFTVAQGVTYTITPSKSNDYISNNGVTLIDALLMRRHLLGTPLNSPYKIIAAAEVNAEGDTTITTQDILFARSLILGNIDAFPTNRLWQFVSSDYVFPDNSHPFPFPTTRTYTNITTNQTNQNFIGIKLGDVNGSWDANIP